MFRSIDGNNLIVDSNARDLHFIMHYTTIDYFDYITNSTKYLSKKIELCFVKINFWIINNLFIGEGNFQNMEKKQ